MRGHRGMRVRGHELGAEGRRMIHEARSPHVSVAYAGPYVCRRMGLRRRRNATGGVCPDTEGRLFRRAEGRLFRRAYLGRPSVSDTEGLCLGGRIWDGPPYLIRRASA